jgi:hypothetical protein
VVEFRKEKGARCNVQRLRVKFLLIYLQFLIYPDAIYNTYKRKNKKKQKTKKNAKQKQRR